MARRLKILTACAFGAAALALAVGLLIPPPKVEGNTILLGATLSLSGRYATNGINTYNGYEIAVERINAAGGIKVGGKKYNLKIIYYDDESSPALGASLAERLIKQDGIKFVLGPYSSEMTKAVARVTEQYRIPMVEAEGASPSLFDHGNKYIFGVLSTAENYLANFIQLAVEKLGKNPKDLKLAIVVQNDRFSLHVRRTVWNDARKYGIEVIIDNKLPSLISDMSRTLEEVRKNNPDILVISGHSKGAEAAARQIKETDIRPPIVAMTHCEAARIIQKFGEATEGFYCPGQWASSLPYKDHLFGTAMDFSIAIKEAYPEENYTHVPYQSASAAAAVMVWKAAFERANSFDTERLRAALASTKLDTFYGRIEFGPGGQIISKPMILRQIQNGQYIVVGPGMTSSGG